jgi:hypothetical protein
MGHIIQTPANLNSATVIGSHLTIASAIEAEIQGLSAQDTIVDISIIRKAVGNNFFAIITYETAPAP